MTKHARKQTPYLAGHQRSWIWGRHAVGEILDAARWPMLELHLAGDLPAEALGDAAAKAKVLGAEALITSRDRLRELCGVAEHQGYLARMGPYPYATLDEALAYEDNAVPPFLLLLDGLRDPHNYGAVIRSAAALGVHAIVVGEEGQAPINNHVARSSAGAVNRIAIARADDLAKALVLLKTRGFLCVAADPHTETPAWSCDMKGPTALVAGNEGAGIRNELRALCDQRIAVPSVADVDSLNVQAAISIVLYEAMRQRRM